MHNNTQKVTNNRISSGGRRRGKQILAAMLSVMLIISLMPIMTVFAAGTPVSSEEEFKIALSGTSPIVVDITGDFNISSTPTVTNAKNITINGNGHTITQSGSNTQVLCMTNSGSNALTVSDLTIDGYGAANTYSYGGGALYIYGGTMTLNRVIIKNCTTNDGGYGGGAISTRSATVTATDCAFIGNTAKYDGGAIYASSVALTNVTMYNNNSGHYGGAIYAEKGGSVTNCTLVNNNAKTYGGGVYNYSSSNALNLKNSILIGNKINNSLTSNNGTDIYYSSSYKVTDGGNNLYGKAYSGFTKASSSVSGYTYPVDWLSDAAPADNGGNHIPTIALIDTGNSPAIDAAGVTRAPAADARGVVRDSKPDIGAFENKLLGEVQSVSVLPATVDVVKGNTQQFSATVLVSNGAAETVTWEVNGANAGGTTITGSGLLTVAADETAQALNVVATSTENPAKSATAVVTVQSAPPAITSITVSPTAASVAKGDTHKFIEDVQGTNNPLITVTWSVDSTKSSIDTYGLLTVGANETAASLTVTATSKQDASKTATATVDVLSAFDVTTGAEFNAAMKSALNPLVINIQEDISGVKAPAITSARKIVINGDGHTLNQADGGMTVKLDEASADNKVEISDLTIIGLGDVNNKNGGGAVYLAAGDVTLTNVSIQDCIVGWKNDPNNQNGLRYGGGAVSVALNDAPNSPTSNGSITATDCSFTGNTVLHTFDNYGGGALSADKVYLTNCTFYGNEAVDCVGGAVYARIGGSMVNCTVVNNTALHSGGGVTGRVAGGGGNAERIHLLNCIVAGNHIGAGKKTGVNVDQVYDQGGNIFGYVHTIIDSNARDEVWAIGGQRAIGTGSVWNVSDERSDLEKWLSYAPGNYGGATSTIALLDAHNSPAIDKGVASGSVSGQAVLNAPVTDQRGETRTDPVDIGAYEFVGVRAAYKGDLEASVVVARLLDESKYTTTTWARLSAALQLAEDVMNDPTVTQASVDSAKLDLDAATSALVLRADAGSLTYLKYVIDFVTGKAFAQNRYTANSWSDYANALALGQAMLASPAAYSSDEATATADDILDQFTALKLKVDKGALEDAIAYAEGRLTDPTLNLIPLYRSALEAELVKAKAVLNNAAATHDEVNQAVLDLSDLIQGEAEAGDKTALQILIKLGASMNSALWTPDSFAPLPDALRAARTVLDDENAVQYEINDAYDALNAVLDGLVQQADFAALNAAIAQAKAIIAIQDEYVPSSIAGLPMAIGEGESVSGNLNASQPEVNAARSALSSEILKARKKANFKQLLAAIQTANALNAELYTSESVSVLTAAVSQGNALLAMPLEVVTQTSVDTATDDILHKVNTLVLKSAVSTPVTTEDGSAAITPQAGAASKPQQTTGGSYASTLQTTTGRAPATPASALGRATASVAKTESISQNAVPLGDESESISSETAQTKNLSKNAVQLDGESGSIGSETAQSARIPIPGMNPWLLAGLVVAAALLSSLLFIVRRCRKRITHNR